MPEWLKSWLRGWALLVVVLAALGYVFGIPAVLIRYDGVSWYGGPPVWTRCHYLGPFGMVEAWPGYDVYEDCPYVALLHWRLAVLGEGRR